MSEENRPRELWTRAKHTQNINNQNSQIAEISVLVFKNICKKKCGSDQA